MKPVRGHLAALFSTVVWATTLVSSKILLRDLTAMDITFLRLFVGYAALAALSPRTIRFRDLKQEVPFMLTGFLGVTAYYLLQNIGLVYTTATNSGIILNLVPIITALLFWLILKDRTDIHGFFFAGSALAITGICLIMLNGEAAGVHLAGDLLTLLAAIAWGLYTLVMSGLDCSGSSLMQVTRRIFFWGLVFTLPFMIPLHFRPDITKLIQPACILHMLYLGIVASALCFVTWNYAIREIGPIRSGIYLYFQPVITVTASVLILHEPLTPYLLLGMILALSGVVLSGLSPERFMKKKR